MKLYIFTVVMLGALFSQAANYKCTYKKGNISDDQVIAFMFDTVTQDNKFLDIGKDIVGCVVLKSSSPLITCGVGNKSENFSLFSTATDGSSVIALDTHWNGSKTNLTCIKAK